MGRKLYNRHMRLTTFLAALLLLTGCGSSPEPAKQAAEKAAPTKAAVPETFKVKFTTSKGDIVVAANRAWSPHGVDRFHELLAMDYFKDGRFFRVVPKFIAQFGVNADPKIHHKWREYFIPDDKRVLDNTRGTLSFAQNGPNSRATEIFINLKNNKELDKTNFVPFAKVVEGMDVVDKLYSGYGDVGLKINVKKVEDRGNEYLAEGFPELDYITKTEILP